MKIAVPTTAMLPRTMKKMPILNDPSKMLDLSNYLYGLAALLTLLATFGVIYFGRVTSRVKEAELTQYQKDADARIAEAHKKAAEANNQAAQANVLVAGSKATAEQAKATASAANQQAEAARATAERSKLDKAKIEEDNLLLQKQVEQERAARIQLERALAPRILLSPIQQTIIGELRQQPPGSVDFIVYGGSAEADNLMKQIAYAFEQAHWSLGFAYPVGGSALGVQIKYDTADPSATRAANILSRNLPLSGIPTAVFPTLQDVGSELGSYTTGGTFGRGRIRVYVGSK